MNSNILSLRLGSGYGTEKYLQEDLQNLNTFNDGRLTASGRLLPNAPIGLSFAFQSRSLQITVQSINQKQNLPLFSM